MTTDPLWCDADDKQNDVYTNDGDDGLIMMALSLYKNDDAGDDADDDYYAADCHAHSKIMATSRGMVRSMS